MAPNVWSQAGAYVVCPECQKRIDVKQPGVYLRTVGPATQLCCPNRDCGAVDWYRESDLRNDAPGPAVGFTPTPSPASAR